MSLNDKNVARLSAFGLLLSIGGMIVSSITGSLKQERLINQRVDERLSLIAAAASQQSTNAG